MRMGNRFPESMISRTHSSIRCSSSPEVDGAPAVRITLPPSWSTSVARKVTSFRSAAACTFRTSSSSCSAASAGPDPRISSSVPSKWMNATVTRRCSGSWCRAVSAERRPTGIPWRMSVPRGMLSNGTNASEGTSGARRRRKPDPFAPPTWPGRRADAVTGLITICPASAVPSISTVVLAAGPVTISSRCDPPTRKKWKSPEWTPTDIRSDTFWPRTTSRPTVRSARRISTAARQPRTSCALPEK